MKAVIFDMDGVLIDSEPLYVEMLKEFFILHQIAFDEAELPAVIACSHQRVMEIVRDIWVQTKDEVTFISIIRNMKTVRKQYLIRSC